MSKEMLYALIAREGIKTALELASIWGESKGDAEVLERVKALEGRKAEDYERERQS